MQSLAAIVRSLGYVDAFMLSAQASNHNALPLLPTWPLLLLHVLGLC